MVVAGPTLKLRGDTKRLYRGLSQRISFGVGHTFSAEDSGRYSHDGAK
jgi:hypothetical protein